MCSFAFVFESKGNEGGKLELLLFLFVFVGGRGGTGGFAFVRLFRRVLLHL